jgi:hypothetical protein
LLEVPDDDGRYVRSRQDRTDADLRELFQEDEVERKEPCIEHFL